MCISLFDDFKMHVVWLTTPASSSTCFPLFNGIMWNVIITENVIMYKAFTSFTRFSTKILVIRLVNGGRAVGRAGGRAYP